MERGPTVESPQVRVRLDPAVERFLALLARIEQRRRHGEPAEG